MTDPEFAAALTDDDLRSAALAIRDALLSDDPVTCPPRTVLYTPSGQVLVMPAASARSAGVKIVSVAPGNPGLGLPRIQGVYTLLDATLSVRATHDAVGLTLARTAAVSYVAAAAVTGRPGVSGRVVIVGTGPQAAAHALLLLAHEDPESITVVGRRTDAARAVVELIAARHPEATLRDADTDRLPSLLPDCDLLICATTARQPLIDDAASGSLPVHALVVAVGSHEPDARELPGALMARSSVVVESVETAWREAGDLVMAAAEHPGVAPAGVLREVLRGGLDLPADRVVVIKTCGEAWQDLAVATAWWD